MKRDNRGVSLVEIIIAITILVLCALPLFKSMILTAQMNLKSRQLLAATNTAEEVMENLKADGMEQFIEKNKNNAEIDEIQYIEENSKKTGYSFVYPEYKMDKQKFRVQVEVKPYKNTDTSATDYNTQEVANMYRMNLATDAIYVQDDKNVEEDFLKAVAENKLKSEQEDEVLNNLDIEREYVVSIDEQVQGQRVEQTIRYSYKGLLLGEHVVPIYNNKSEKGDLENLYIFFEPGNKDTITIKNLNNYPLRVYIVKQGEQKADLSVNLYGTELLEEMGEEKDPDFTKGIRLRTNLTSVDKVVFYYDRLGTTLALNQEKLEKYFALNGLDGQGIALRLYDVTIQIMKDGKEITTLTGTVTR